MRANIEYREVAADNPEWKDFPPMFRVVIDGTSRILMIPQGDVYTLQWNGRVDFESLEDKVLGELPHKISLGAPRIDLSDSRLTGSAVARLILAQDIAEFELTEDEGHSTVAQILQQHHDPDSLGFVRVDVDWPRRSAIRPVFSFSFSSENNPLGKDNELAVRLPAYMPVNYALIEWIFENHSNPPGIDLADCQSVASRLSRLRPPHLN